MIGAILFTDPADDGNVTVANGYAAYPDGPARNPSSVQRGSVQFLSTYPGDPTTPGYPSIGEDIPRTGISDVTPQIPSIPISMLDAQPILAALNGHGPSGEKVDREYWIGGLDADYSAGPAPGVTLSMSNYMEGTFTDIWNAIGIINGTNSDETIVIGNHRDAWPIGGAADPNSGTALIVEMGRALGLLLDMGWQPTRNVVLCSWDAEEYGLLGSTEWMEEYVRRTTSETSLTIEQVHSVADRNGRLLPEHRCWCERPASQHLRHARAPRSRRRDHEEGPLAAVWV